MKVKIMRTLLNNQKKKLLGFNNNNKNKIKNMIQLRCKKKVYH